MVTVSVNYPGIVTELREQAKIREEFVDKLLNTMLILSKENQSLRTQVAILQAGIRSL